MALQLVKHAFLMIFGNLNDAIKASAVPFMILIGLNVLGAAFLGISFSGPSAELPTAGLLGGAFFYTIILLVVSFFVFGWIAVTWHRFVLLEEYPDTVPAIANRPIWPYIGQSILIGLLLVACMIPVMFVLGGLTGGFGQGSMTGLVIVGTIVGLILAYLWLRLAITLPGIAIGKPMRIRDGWELTKPMGGTIFGVAVILAVINAMVGLVLTPLSFIPILGFALNMAVQWITIMVGLSVLTTLYGHLVEGRDLPT